MSNRPPFRQRLTLLIVLAGIVVLFFTWVAIDTARVLGALRQQTTAMQVESLELDEYLESWALRANSLLLDPETPPPAEKFEGEARILRNWLLRKEHLFAAPDERELLIRIRANIDAYHVAALALIAGGEHPGKRRFDVQQSSTVLLSSAIELGELHAKRQGALLTASERLLRRLEFAGLSAFFVFCAAVALLIRRAYVLYVEPLRLQVIEARDQAARHEKLASLGVLAAGVAHEIRNPLTAVKARLFTLGRRLPEDSPARGDAKLIGAEIDRLEKIVQDFLTFARPRDLELTRLPLRSLLEELAALLTEPLADEDKTLVLGEMVEAEVEVDADQMKQVLINLIRNAGEAVAPHTGQIVLRTLREGDRVVIEIADNGGGIPGDVQGRLFDPFFSTKSAGTGLGLSIALRIVEQHGGKLRYQTGPNSGTTFGIVLPVV